MRNKVINLSINKNTNYRKQYYTNHNSFILKTNKSNSKNNILNNTNITTNNRNKKNKIDNNINYNFHIIES